MLGTQLLCKATKLVPTVLYESYIYFLSIKTSLYYPNKTWIQCANMNIELMHDDAMAGRDYDEDDND